MFWQKKQKTKEARREPRCHICQSPWQEQIDLLIAKGWTFTAVARRWQGFDASVKNKTIDGLRKSVERHSKNHIGEPPTHNIRPRQHRTRSKNGFAAISMSGNPKGGYPVFRFYVPTDVSPELIEFYEEKK